MAAKKESGRTRAFDSLIVPPVTKHPPMPSGAAVPARAPKPAPPSTEPSQAATAQSE
jgi:hypothetical protein